MDEIIHSIEGENVRRHRRTASFKITQRAIFGAIALTQDTDLHLLISSFLHLIDSICLGDYPDPYRQPQKNENIALSEHLIVRICRFTFFDSGTVR